VTREQPVFSCLLPSSSQVTGCTDFPLLSFAGAETRCYAHHFCKIIVAIHRVGENSELFMLSVQSRCSIVYM
jgi:hypothetical protein